VEGWKERRGGGCRIEAVTSADETGREERLDSIDCEGESDVNDTIWIANYVSISFDVNRTVALALALARASSDLDSGGNKSS
jgi:hypothetical protein